MSGVMDLLSRNESRIDGMHKGWTRMQEEGGRRRKKEEGGGR
jgi:hypothetical protein